VESSCLLTGGAQVLWAQSATVPVRMTGGVTSKFAKLMAHTSVKVFEPTDLPIVGFDLLRYESLRVGL
jgi:hypothetical protein